MGLITEAAALVTYPVVLIDTRYADVCPQLEAREMYKRKRIWIDFCGLLYNFVRGQIIN